MRERQCMREGVKAWERCVCVRERERGTVYIDIINNKLAIRYTSNSLWSCYKEEEKNM